MDHLTLRIEVEDHERGDVGSKSKLGHRRFNTMHGLQQKGWKQVLVAKIVVDDNGRWGVKANLKSDLVGVWNGANGGDPRCQH